MYPDTEGAITSKASPLTPGAIRHLPAARQRRYVRLAILGILRDSERDLNVPEIRERTGLDDRTIRDELRQLVGTREVEKIHRRGPATYRLVGNPTNPFAKHMVRLQHGVYSIDHVRTLRGEEMFVVQERLEGRDGTYEPIGGLVVRREDLVSFLGELRRRAEDTLELKVKSEEG